MQVSSFKFSPHSDIELGIPRQDIEAFVVHPAEPCADPPPLVITIPGYGETANSEYFLEKLNGHIARKYGCLVLSVNYHGIVRTPSRYDFSHVPSLVLELQSLFGWVPSSPRPDMAILEFVQWAKDRGIRKLPSSLKRFIRIDFPEYHSFGLLPALDHFSAISELAKRYRFDPRRIVVYGSSYGGYIANLMAKFAPGTFSMVIDNSGFNRVQMTDLLQRDLMDGFAIKDIVVDGAALGFPVVPSYPWTLDEQAPTYFSDARRGIRSLLIAEHWLGSRTRHCIYHSVGDRLVPVAEKDSLVELLCSQGRRVVYHRVNESDIDGNAYKTLEHGMDASLRALFEKAIPGAIPDIGYVTDYERKAVIQFPCGSQQYHFSFGRDYSFHAELREQSKPARRLRAPRGTH